MSKQRNSKSEKNNNNYSKGKGRSKKPNSPQFEEKYGKLSAAAYGGNDISWYTRNPELTNSAALIPFAYQPGRNIPLGAPEFANGISIASYQPDVFNYQYPGIMTIEFLPTVGRSTSIDSPINVAAKEIYSKIRSKYSGSLEADSPDIMMYLIALDSMLMFVEDLKRCII